jgi:flagellum-specific peptidoglycan hydrolase FlgJ
VQPASKPWWQQVTALVSLSMGGAITGFSFVPKAAADIKAPATLPIHLLALEHAAKPVAAGDSALRSAIVNVASYYLQLARGKTPAEIEALIWRHDSVDGADHGSSCAAFASLTLELAAHAVGGQSWVTGGTSYPWPLHKWADVRVEPNPASPGIVSVLQDARAHGRWHPLDGGYRPLPGDWVLFEGHIEVVTSYTGGVLHTVGGDSLPNFSVNAHAYRDPLGDAGVVGFVNNGTVAPGTVAPGTVAPGTVAPGMGTAGTGAAGTGAAGTGAGDSGHGALKPRAGEAAPQPEAAPGAANAAPPAELAGDAVAAQQVKRGGAAIPGLTAKTRHAAARQDRSTAHGQAALGPSARGPAARPAERGQRARTAQRPTVVPPAHPAAPSAAPGAPGAAAQRAFIAEVAPGAIEAQQRYGVPASVTIAQAIEESGWGRSSLATAAHNLFGIKGTGPAGSAQQQTREYHNGRWMTRTSAFRRYHDVAQSIADHGRLLATSGYYLHAMSYRHDPNAFAVALTGVYATDPDYGSKLIALMQRYDLYRYDAAASPQPSPTAPAVTAHAGAPGSARIPGLPKSSPAGRATARIPRPRTAPSVPRTAPSVPGAAPSVPGTAAAASQPAAAAARFAASAAAVPGLSPVGAPAPAGRGAVARAADPAHGPQGNAGTRAWPKVAPPGDAAAAKRLRTASPARQPRTAAAVRSTGAGSARYYRPQFPPAVQTTLVAAAKPQLLREEPLYRDVCAQFGIGWELLAACDWMQCRAQPQHSPVHGEKLGTVNPDGTVYRTRSEALAQCAFDLAKLTRAVYRIDLTAPGPLSVRELANTFAAFRWGALLRLHQTSAMEFPYSVAGLTAQHLGMRWPNIDEPNAPDKPGGRFRMPFGAVPVVLALNYPATV